MMQLTLLGTGGTQPLPDRALASLAVTVQGHTLLLDCGEGTQVSLRKYGVSAYRIDAVLLTHYHGDHILGLPGLLQTLASLNRTAPLTIYGPPGQESIAAAIMALARAAALPCRVEDRRGHMQRSRPDGHAVPPQAPRALLRLPAAPAPGRAVRRRTGQGRGYPAGILAGAAGRAEHRRLCAGRRIRPAPPGG